jgi:hypothetical protein
MNGEGLYGVGGYIGYCPGGMEWLPQDGVAAADEGKTGGIGGVRPSGVDKGGMKGVTNGDPVGGGIVEEY